MRWVEIFSVPSSPDSRQARQRQRLKPLSDKVRSIEKQLAANRNELEALVMRLADETLYTDPKRKLELTDVLKEQASLNSQIETLEWEWMTASEALERANPELKGQN